MNYCDIAVIGAGPAGLTAGSFCAARGLKTIVFESGAPGGLLKSLFPEKIVMNYPGYAKGIKASTLADELISSAIENKAEIKNERVVELTKEKAIKTEEGKEYKAGAVIIACGNRPKELGIPGEAEFNIGDKGVYYYVTEPEKFKKKRVIVVGGGDSAVDAALEVSNVAEEVFLVHRRGEFRAVEKNLEKAKQAKNIKIITNAELREIKGDAGGEAGGKVKGAVIFRKDTNKEEHLDADSIVLAVGLIPNTEIFKKTGVDIDEEGRIITNCKQETLVEGIFAAGDVVSGTGTLELIAVACAQGAVAAHYAYLKVAEPYWG